MVLRLLGVVFVARCAWLAAGSSLADNDDRRLEIGSDSHFAAEGHAAIDQHKARLVRREGDKLENARAGLESADVPEQPKDAGATHNVTCMACSYAWISKDAEDILYCPVMIKDEAMCGGGTDIGNKTDVGNCSTSVLNAGGMFFMFGREGTPHAFECLTSDSASDGNCIAEGCCGQGLSLNPNFDYYKIEPKSLKPLYNDLVKTSGKAALDRPVELDMEQVQDTDEDMMKTDICGPKPASAARAQGCTEALITEKQQKREQKLKKELDKQLLEHKLIDKKNEEFERSEERKKAAEAKRRNEGD